MRLGVLLILFTATRAFASVQMAELFWDAHSRVFARVLIDHDHGVRIFLGRRPILHQVEVSDPEWYESETEFHARIGTGQTVKVRNIDTQPVMYVQSPETLSLLYVEAMASERAGLLSADEILRYVRQRSFRESERWLRVAVDDVRLRREFQLVAHPLREVDLDFIDSCERTIVPLNDNRPRRRP